MGLVADGESEDDIKREIRASTNMVRSEIRVGIGEEAEGGGELRMGRGMAVDV